MSENLHQEIINKIVDNFKHLRFSNDVIKEYVETIFLGVSLSKMPSGYELILIRKQIERMHQIDELEKSQNVINNRLRNIEGDLKYKQNKFYPRF